MFSSSTYSDRSPERSYKRPPLGHSQTGHNFSSLGSTQPPLSSSQLHSSQLPSSWSTSFSPQSSLSSSVRDGSGYLPGYLLSATQGMPLPEGSQRYEDPPLLPSKSSQYGSTSPGAFGAENSDQHMSRQQPLDEDAPPTQSVLDEINTIPVRRDPFKTPVRNQRNQRTGTGKEWQEIIIFGFPEDKYAAAIKLFTALGETREPERGPNGANWFKIAFKHEWEAARAVRKNGELINGAWMVGVKWADRRESWAGTGGYGTPASPAVGDEASSPTATRSNPIGRPVTLEPSSTAYRANPGGTTATAGFEDWAGAHAAASTPGREKTKGLFGLVGW